MSRITKNADGSTDFNYFADFENKSVPRNREIVTKAVAIIESCLTDKTLDLEVRGELAKWVVEHQWQFPSATSPD